MDTQREFVQILSPDSPREEAHDTSIGIDEYEENTTAEGADDVNNQKDKRKKQQKIKINSVVKASTEMKKTPMHQAAEVGDAKRLDALVREDPDFITLPNEDGQTPLHLAAKGMHAQCCEILLTANTKGIDKKDKVGATPLLLSISSGITSFNTTKVILSKSASTSIATKSKKTALHIAADKGNIDTLKLLLEIDKKGLDVKDGDKCTPLHLAAKRGQVSICKELILAGAKKEEKDNRGYSALHWAAKVGFSECMKELLNLTCDVDCKDKDENTPLHLFCMSGKDRSYCAEILLNHGANPNAKNKEGKTVFHAVQTSPFEVKQVFKGRSIDLAVTDGKGKTALHYAAGRHNTSKHVDFILMMEEMNNVDVNSFINTQDKKGDTALHIAVTTGVEDSCRLLIKTGADGNITNESGSTALHLAAEKGFKDICGLLLTKGVKIDVKDAQLRTPLHVAARNGHRECCDLLTKKGGNMRSMDSDDNTALHNAAEGSHASCCNLIKDKQPNLAYRFNRFCKTPLHIAIDMESLECCKVLVPTKTDLWALHKGEIQSPLRVAYDKSLYEIFGYLLHKCSMEKSTKWDMDFRKLMEESLVNSNRQLVKIILDSEYWEKSFQSYRSNEQNSSETEQLSQTSNHGGTVATKNLNMKNLVDKYPDLAKELFDKCLPSEKDQGLEQGSASSNTKQEEYCNLQYLDDVYGERGDNSVREGSEESLLKNSDSILSLINPENGQIWPKVKIESVDHVWRQDHILSCVISQGYPDLLTHPLVNRWMNYKWNRYVRYGYGISVVWALLHASLLTVFASSAWDWREVHDQYKLNQTYVCNSKMYNVGPEVVQYLKDEAHFPNVISILVAAEMLLWIIYQSYKTIKLRCVRVKRDSFLLLICLSTDFMFLMNFSKCSWETYVREDWQWVIGPFALVFAWVNFYHQLTHHIRFKYMLFNHGKLLTAARDILVPVIPIIVMVFFFYKITPKGSLTLLQNVDWLMHTFHAMPSFGTFTVLLLVAIVILAQFRNGQNHQKLQDKNRAIAAINMILDFDVLYPFLRRRYYVAWIPVEGDEDTKGVFGWIKRALGFSDDKPTGSLIESSRDRDLHDLFNVIVSNVARSQGLMANVQLDTIKETSSKNDIYLFLAENQSLMAKIQTDISNYKSNI